MYLNESNTCTTQTTEKVKILKSYYKKDASASVTTSFLSIENDKTNTNLKQFNNNNNNNNSESSSPLSCSSFASSSSNSVTKHKSQNSALNDSNSCISFVNQLVEEKITNCADSSSKTLPLFKNKKKSSLIKRFSQKSVIQEQTESSDIYTYGVRLITKILVAANTNTSSNSLNNSIDTKSSLSSISATNIPQSQSFPTNTQMQHSSNLTSKKLRKLLPFNTGLKNHGNTCFMNCVLQSLFHTSPLTDYFITNQFDHDIQAILSQRHQNLLNNTLNSSNKQLPAFILSKHFHRLLLSTWQNTYDPSYSAELKQLIGYLNPTFAGVNQNDSHEFCVWLLDRLSQELTYRVLSPKLNVNSVEDKEKFKPHVTSSFIEELFKIEFKSTIICSKCNYKSSKFETDMMLSLPLPQVHRPQKPVKNSNLNYLRRSLYVNLILSSPVSIKHFNSKPNSSSASSSPSSTSSFSSHSSKSKFYLSDLNSNSTEFINDLSSSLHVKIGVNIHVTNDLNGFCRELAYLNENGASTAATVINPDLGDLRKYVESAYKISSSTIVFIDLNNIKSVLFDQHALKESFRLKNGGLSVSNSSFCAIELHKLNPKDQSPLINIIATNVYLDSAGRLVCFGLPFCLLINRDCNYSELCKKLMEAQSKYFKDKKKFFSLSLINGSKQGIRISQGDELPLYAECVDKALNESMLAEVVEHICITIEWRSYDEISSFLRDTDFTKADFIHSTVKQLQKLDESEATSQHGTFQANESSNSELTTLNDCFELFTECEELTDENSWTCTKCKRQTNAYKKLSISSVPPILIIHLKRFFYKSKSTNFKLTTPVWFPVSNLDMSKHLTKSRHSNDMSLDSNFDLSDDYNDSNSDRSSNSNKPFVYDLFAVCNHKGQNMANGHYTAYCKNPIDTKWYCFDDFNSTPLFDTTSNGIFNNGSANVCTENAYILFYKKRNCMRNEKWWVNSIDRSLLEYNEFEYFMRNLDYIQKQQQLHQNQQQVNFLQQVKKLNQDEDLCQRELDRLERNEYSYEIVNSYDELNKPKRLQKQLTSSPSTKGLSNNTLSPLADTETNLINFNESSLSNDLKQQMSLRNDVDFLLNYPSDNEYIYRNKNLSQLRYMGNQVVFQQRGGGAQVQVQGQPGTSNNGRYVNPSTVETHI